MGARAVVLRTLHVAPPTRIYFEVVQAALYDIGRSWERGETSVAQEHLATHVAEVVMVDLAPSLPREEPHGRVAIVACAAHELHDIGSRIVADFLAADGWIVLALGAMTPSGALAELAAARRADVVALSVTMTEHLPDVARASVHLRALPQRPFLAAGGMAFDGKDAGADLDLDLVTEAPDALVRVLRERLLGGAGA